MDDEVRLGVSVGRKVGGAVERNKVKRAMREAFWELADAACPPGYDFVLVGRAGVADLVEREGTDGPAASIAEPARRGGERERAFHVKRRLRRIAGPFHVKRCRAVRLADPAARPRLPPLLSPALGPRCRYYPTCSAYAERVGPRARRRSAARSSPPGACCAATRFSNGGFDPVERPPPVPLRSEPRPRHPRRRPGTHEPSRRVASSPTSPRRSSCSSTTRSASAGAPRSSP